jgi:hypothetical protein
MVFKSISLFIHLNALSTFCKPNLEQGLQTCKSTLLQNDCLLDKVVPPNNSGTVIPQIVTSFY